MTERFFLESLRLASAALLLQGLFALPAHAQDTV